MSSNLTLHYSKNRQMGFSPWSGRIKSNFYSHNSTELAGDPRFSLIYSLVSLRLIFLLREI